MCTSPISVKQNGINGNHSILVPCGKCADCVRQKQNDLMVRIYEELTQCSKACFVTLTYRPETVPYVVKDGKKFLTVYKKDVQLWLKRFRTNYERKTGKTGIRFFLCSEYGSKTNRPHYHAIFFGLSKDDLELALSDWYIRFGYVLAKDIDYSSKSLQCSARYVSKYACKGLFENPFCIRAWFAEEFSVVQQGLRCHLYQSKSVVPFVFFMSSFEGLEQRQACVWSEWRESLRFFLGRGLETQDCYCR